MRLIYSLSFKRKTFLEKISDLEIPLRAFCKKVLRPVIRFKSFLGNVLSNVGLAIVIVGLIIWSGVLYLISPEYRKDYNNVT
jgi:hypothetical protein